MTNEEILATIKRPKGQTARLPNHEGALAHIQSLRDHAHRCLDGPALLKNLKEKSRKLTVAGEALVDLPPPYKEVYEGIGLHLLAQAFKAQYQISRHPKYSGNRPTGIGKLRLVDLCRGVIYTHFGGRIARRGEAPPPPGSTLLTAPDKIDPRAIALAQVIWEAENLGTTTSKAWTGLVKESWDDYRKAWSDGLFKEEENHY